MRRMWVIWLSGGVEPEDQRLTPSVSTRALGTGHERLAPDDRMRQLLARNCASPLALSDSRIPE